MTDNSQNIEYTPDNDMVELLEMCARQAKTISYYQSKEYASEQNKKTFKLLDALHSVMNENKFFARTPQSQKMAEIARKAILEYNDSL